MTDENRDNKPTVESSVIRVATPDDASGIAQVHLDSWETTYRGILPDAALAARSYEVRIAQWARILRDVGSDDMVVVAESGGEIVGFASGGPERSDDLVYDGELYAIYLRNDHQARGIGRELTQAVATHLLQRGKRAMLVWVLSDNPSRVFYERLGGTPVRTTGITFGDKEYEETVYGWPDIRALLMNA